MTNLWVYKNNAKRHDHQWSWGDWEDFFTESGGLPFRWGDSADISPSNRRPVFAMKPGDLVLCWQSDRRAALGIAVVTELPEYVGAEGRTQREIHLQPVDQFQSPVPILDLRKTSPALAAVKAFDQGHVRTIYPTTVAEAATLLAACHFAVPANLATVVRRANAKSERAAVDYVTATYEASGWTVTTRETEKIGYDLDAVKGRRTLHLEVKGSAGSDPAFFLSANEHRAATTDAAFKLCLVTNATSKSARQLFEWTGAELLQQGTFSPASFRVRMAPP